MPSFSAWIEYAFLARHTAREIRRMGRGRPETRGYEEDARRAFRRAYAYLQQARERREWDNARAN